MITLCGVPINITMFPDGTSQVWRLGDMYGDVRWKFEHEGEIMHLAQVALLLRKNHLPRHLIIEYLPYARQDKEVRNDATFALRAFGPLLNAMNWDSVTIMDPHSAVATGVISKSRALYYTEEVKQVVEENGYDMLCYPDEGAAEKYGPMFRDIPSMRAEKVREQSTGKITGMTLRSETSAEKKVLIVDDICDGGATFIQLAKLLREAGAASVSLFVSHGLFTKGTDVLFNSGIDRIFTPEGERV